MSKSDAVLINIKVSEKKPKALKLSALIAEAESDVKERRTRPAREFLRELKQRVKV